MGITREKRSGKRSAKAQTKAEAASTGVQQYSLDEYSVALCGASLPSSGTTTGRTSPKKIIPPTHVSSQPCSLNAPMYKVDSIPGKGLGLIATQRIPRGTLVLAENPLIRFIEREEQDESRFEKTLLDTVNGLGTFERKFRKLHDSHKSGFSKEKSIYFSNCYNLTAPRSRHGGSCVGLVASRINHSCISNVEFSFWEGSASGLEQIAVENGPTSSKTTTGEDKSSSTEDFQGLMKFHALRTIKSGEEIVSNYDSIYHTAEERQWRLQMYYGFQCSSDCRACTPSTSHQAKSDERRRSMTILRGRIAKAEATWRSDSAHANRSEESKDNKDNAVYEIEEIVDCLKQLTKELKDEQLLGLELANTYNRLVRWSERAHDMEAVRMWAIQERETCVAAFGMDSRQVKKVDIRLQKLMVSPINKVKTQDG